MLDSDFIEGVYVAVAAIPKGRVLTYGDVARLAGGPNYARMAGRILHENPLGRSLPCHRVVNSLGRLCPGWTEQAVLLKNEGVVLKANGCVDLKRYHWNYNEAQP